MLRKSVSSRRAFSECRMRLKLWRFFFQRPAKGHRADRLAGLFLQASLQGSNLMRLLGGQLLQSLVVVLIQDRRAATAGFVDEPVESRCLPLFEPSRYGIAANLQYPTDLVDSMALITQQDGVRTPA